MEAACGAVLQLSTLITGSQPNVALVPSNQRGWKEYMTKRGDFRLKGVCTRQRRFDFGLLSHSCNHSHGIHIFPCIQNAFSFAIYAIEFRLTFFF